MLVSYGLLHHRMFVSIRLTSFQSRHFQLSIDITPMSVCWVFAELHFILVTFFEEQLAEMEKTKSASCLFSFFFPNHKVLLYSWVYTKKIDTSKFQLMYNTYLYDQNRRSILMSFALVLKKRVGIAGDTAVPLGLTQVLSISSDHPWDGSTPSFESSCVWLYWLDLIRKATHLSI